MTQYDSFEEFESFCDKLEEPGFRKLFMKYLIATYGSRKIADVVRSVLKASMTDSLMCQFNRTGARNKKQLNPLFEKCMYYTVKHFQKGKELKVHMGGSEVKTTVRMETERQTEKYLSNANTQLKRSAN